MRNFAIGLTALALVFAGIYYGVVRVQAPEFYLTHLYWALGIIWAVTLVIHAYLLRRIPNSNQRQFNASFMGLTTAKLLIYLFGLVIYALFATATAKVFLVGFLALYLIFSVIEVWAVLAYIKRFRSQNF